MNGFYTTDGINCLGYYTQQDLPFYYSLFSEFTLCVNYFCPVMGPTYPNRFYLVAGTSGGSVRLAPTQGRLRSVGRSSTPPGSRAPSMRP
jgi:phospholipase C